MKEKNMRMDKSKENTLRYIHMYIYTHTHGHTNIYIQIHIFRYTHYVLFKSDCVF